MNSMFDDRISDYIDTIAAKYLTAVDADPGTSNQHEVGGLIQAGFGESLGRPDKRSEFRFRARQVFISNDQDEPLIVDDVVTWYDARRKVEHRGPEYRLYYHDNPVMSCRAAGQFFLIAKLKPGVMVAEESANISGDLLMILAPADSAAERQLRILFGLQHVDERFKPGELDAGKLMLPLRLMLEDLGIQLHKQQDDDYWLEQLHLQFGTTHFPQTSAFSQFARDTLPDEVSPQDDPDHTLLAWMTHEEYLFRLRERQSVLRQLKQGFGNDTEAVDAFIAFSLSVQNRRKSRVGHAFESHLHHLFIANGVQVEQGRGAGKVTENNAKPDFLFPSFKAYQDEHYPAHRLTMLGAKTTCKDRWRQVLSEANRIPEKHLVTLEAAISENQTQEMQHHRLQLVVPKEIALTYSPRQQQWLLNLQQFIQHVRQKQA
ncbi:type II restriction endonuclease [Leeia sp.]|uniref:type II restriction endonuclease n=1 Tax=Leeia sp. TaxID=2884678 RepID=UPI0035B047E5